MIANLTPVNSSNLAAVGYDLWSATLTIEFNDGSVYEYYNVPRSEYQGLMNADSHGKYFHACIEGYYQYRRVA